MLGSSETGGYGNYFWRCWTLLSGGFCSICRICLAVFVVEASVILVGNIGQNFKWRLR